MKLFWGMIGSVLLFVSIQISALDAPVALRPSGLNPGDTYYVIFVADDSRNMFHCQTINTADIDNHGINAAAAGSVTSGVTGWQSLYIHATSSAPGTVTDTVSATGVAFNNVTDRPIYNTMLQLVANDRPDLFDGSTSGAGTALTNLINFDEDGNAYTFNEFAFTGFDELGNQQVGLTLGYDSGPCFVGDPDRNDGRWAAAGNSSGSRSIYVLSPLLTIPSAASAPVPTVSTFPL